MRSNSPKRSSATPRKEKEEGPALAANSRESKKQAGLKFFPIVAIGASAGGLEAFTRLLKALPPDTGMAFVLVQHLDPKRDSMLADLLSKQTRMPVEDIADKLRVQPDHVYVMPPNVSIGIEGGVFQTKARQDERLPVDVFMRSLAEERKSRAIAVILSGTASDGTIGVAAIKAEGGIAFAEEPKSAGFDGMPRSAIASGNIDFILPPEAIAHELVRISRHPYVNHVRDQARAEDAVEAGAKNDMDRVLGLLQKSSGVDFRKYRPNTIHRRTMRRMLVHKLDSLAEYMKYLRDHPEEREKLYNDILIPVTHFFRNPDAFEALKGKIYPAIVKDKSNQRHIRVWAPGCSTGEETYSLAMTLLEFLGDKASSFQVQVFGTDVSEKGIAKARAGVYSEAISQDVSPERLRRFFVKVEEGYRVNKAVREMCVFARQDLTIDPPFSQMNLVVCRNLLIYLEPELQEKVLPILHYALKPSGFLILGHSESATAFPHLFIPVDKRHKIFSKRAVSTRVHYDFSTTHYPVETGLVPAKAASPKGGEPGFLQSESDRIVLRDYAPAGVVINDAMEIVQFRGRTSPYLEPAPGKASLNVLKLAHKELAAELRKAINVARSKGVAARRKQIALRRNGQTGAVDLSVVPLGTHSEDTDGRNYLVLFEEGASAAGYGKSRSGRNKADTRDRESLRLQRELEASRDALRIATESEEAMREEFQSANEEVMSANEELQSTNEELETSKEELQSANEELNTVNDELHHRNLDLSLLSNDLTNLMNSTRIPVVMLDQGLRIRRFTSTAGTLLKVQPSDIGRPITDIRPNIRVANLDRLIAHVMDSLHAAEHEVQDWSEHWYSLQIHPYRTADNRIDGVVLALLDVDLIKRSNEQLRKSTEFFRGVIDTVREPLLVLDTDLRVIAANDAFFSTFQVTSQETVKHFLYRIGNEQWNIPKLRALLEDVLPKAAEIKDFEVEHDFPVIGRRTMLLNARQLAQANEHSPMILLAIEDITERKHAAERLQRTAEFDEAVMANMSEGLYTVDSRGGVTAMNPAAEKLFGWSLEELRGKRMHDMTHHTHPDGSPFPAEECSGFSVLREGKPVSECHDVFIRRDGTFFDVIYSSSPIREDGKITGLVVVFRDITAAKRAEEALRRSEKLATAGRMAASLAHEINNPLQSVSNLMALIGKHSELDDEARSYAVLAEKELGRVVHLIRQSLGFYRESTAPTKVQLSETIGAVVDLYEKQIEGKGLTIVKQYEAAGTIESFPGEIQQILSTFLVNAFEASKAGGVITLRVTRSSDPKQQGRRGVRISICDTGAGIPKNVLPHIFEPFFTTKGEQGTGLGLWVTQGIVNRLGGSVSVRSRNGTPRSGTCFSVFLPNDVTTSAKNR